MGKIKETPTHIREYYKAMRDAYTQKKEDAEKEKRTLQEQCEGHYRNILHHFNEYNNYGINLSEFPEFVNNEYENGDLLRAVKAAYKNEDHEYEIIPELHQLLQLAEKQYRISQIPSEIEFFDKVLSVKIREYIRYLREYFTIVHKKLILDGCAYRFGHHLGDIFINRVRSTSKRKDLDFKATREKKAEILARGGRIYNKEEADFCEQNGLTYEYEDHRVFLNIEYFYELVATNQSFENHTAFTFLPKDYRSADLRGKTNDMLIEDCGRDLNKICELQVDIKTKLALCNKVDKTLYTKFVRNENQTSYKYDPTSRKD